MPFERIAGRDTIMDTTIVQHRMLLRWSLLLILGCSFSSAFALPALMRREYTFAFDGEQQSISIELSTSAYLHYRTRQRTWDYGTYTEEEPEFPVIASFAEQLSSAGDALDLNEWDKVRFALAFVQHMKFDPDERGEYPRFPIETLVDGGGDCEDTAILLAAILDAWGLDCVLLSPPGHMALGLAVQGIEGVYYPYKERRYYYVETTGKNWEIGQVPAQYNGKARIIQLHTPGGPHRTLTYIPKAIEPDAPLEFVLQRSSLGETGRLSYRYKLWLEGGTKLLEDVSVVRYQRQHSTFPEYREGTWIESKDRKTGFSTAWTAWGHAPIAVQVEFKNGKVLETVITQAPTAGTD
jgi:hypothetical protein